MKFSFQTLHTSTSTRPKLIFSIEFREENVLFLLIEVFFFFYLLQIKIQWLTNQKTEIFFRKCIKFVHDLCEMNKKKKKKHPKYFLVYDLHSFLIVQTKDFPFSSMAVELCHTIFKVKEKNFNSVKWCVAFIDEMIQLWKYPELSCFFFLNET